MELQHLFINMIRSNLSHRLAVQSYINNCQTPSMAPCGPAGNAARFTLADADRLQVSTSSLDVTGSSFCGAGWAKVRVTQTATILSQAVFLPSINGWQVGHTSAGQVFFSATENWTTVYTAASTYTENVWFFFAFWFDALTNIQYIQVNNGTIYTLQASLGVSSTNLPFNFCYIPPYNFGDDVDMQNVGFWKRTLTAEERTSLYNSGTGRSYSSLDSSLKRNLISWWALNETSGSRLDSHSANHLTDNNTVGYTSGIVPEVWHNPRTALMNWADGIVDVGGSALWNKLICWPMIKGQNKGSGTVVYSLGGLGSYNGTMVNSPTWGDTGINFNAASNSWVTTGVPILSNTSDRTVISVFNSIVGPTTYSSLYTGWDNGTSPNNLGASLKALPNWVGYAIAAYGYTEILSVSVSAPNFIAASMAIGGGGLAGYFYKDSSSGISFTSAPTTSITHNFFVGASFDTPTTGIIPFSSCFSSALSDITIQNIRTLYKQTLGIGLNLP